MAYSKRRQKIEYRAAQCILLLLTFFAYLGADAYLGSMGFEESGALATALVALPGLYAFYTFRIVERISRFPSEAMKEGID